MLKQRATRGMSKTKMKDVKTKDYVVSRRILVNGGRLVKECLAVRLVVGCDTSHFIPFLLIL